MNIEIKITDVDENGKIILLPLPIEYTNSAKKLFSKCNSAQKSISNSGNEACRSDLRSKGIKTDLKPLSEADMKLFFGADPRQKQAERKSNIRKQLNFAKPSPTAPQLEPNKIIAPKPNTRISFKTRTSLTRTVLERQLKQSKPAGNSLQVPLKENKRRTLSNCSSPEFRLLETQCDEHNKRTKIENIQKLLEKDKLLKERYDEAHETIMTEVSKLLAEVNTSCASNEKENVPANKEGPRESLYRTMRDDFPQLQTPTVNKLGPNTPRRTLNKKLKDQCSLLQDTPRI